MKELIAKIYTWINKKRFNASYKPSGEKTALILNGSKKFGMDGTRLNHTLHNVAKEELESRGYMVLETHIDKGYDIKEELRKIADSSLIIYQMPAWWMGEPWIVKKYIDEVFLGGVGILFENDGRSRKDSTRKYGSGGLSQGKKVLFSVTWNAPLEAFSDKDEFFGGVGVDGVFLHLYKAHQFLGIKPLPSFTSYDVVKNPQVESYIANYKEHLQRVLG